MKVLGVVSLCLTIATPAIAEGLPELSVQLPWARFDRDDDPSGGYVSHWPKTPARILHAG
jgi:hypothetical protein